MAGKFAYDRTNLEVSRASLTQVPKCIEMLFLDHGNWLSAMIGKTFVIIL